MLACTALVGCSSEDDVVNNEEQKFDGDKAYVVVSIKSADNLSGRATSDGLSLGTASENEIKTANFYFYSAEGTYVAEGEPTVEKDGTYSPSEGDNIKLKSKTVVVLNKLTEKGSPKYVLVVLNKPTALSLTGKTIAEAQKEILGAKDYSDVAEDANVTAVLGEGNDAKKYFIMSNSTYKGGDAVDGTGFFATYIEPGQFRAEPYTKTEVAAITDPVEIYVERLAAKVQLTLAENATETLTNVKGTFVKLNEINTVENSEALSGTSKQYYAKIVGWNLNATNKRTYLMKNVPAWTSTVFTGWSDETNKRSYWGHSWNYGLTSLTYPKSFSATNDTKNQDGATDKGTTTATNYPLDYTKWSELSTDLGTDSPLYCAENTNTKKILEATNFHSATTEILLAAQIVDASGNEVELFRYDNMLYDRENYLKRLFDKVAGLTTNKLNVYKKTVEGEGETAKDVYTMVSSGDVKETLMNEGDGRVSVTFAFELAEGENDLTGTYSYRGENGEWTDFVAIEANEKNGKEAKTVKEQVEESLNASFATLFEYEKDVDNTAHLLAEHYNKGMMYYNIPIEHLKDGDKTPYTNGVIDVEEAEYGVVRNHWYQVSISKIENLGSAVHDAEEDIIPSKDENVLYYVAARINILSWKIVNQSVDL